MRVVQCRLQSRELGVGSPARSRQAFSKTFASGGVPAAKCLQQILGLRLEVLEIRSSGQYFFHDNLLRQCPWSADRRQEVAVRRVTRWVRPFPRTRVRPCAHEKFACPFAPVNTALAGG